MGFISDKLAHFHAL